MGGEEVALSHPYFPCERHKVRGQMFLKRLGHGGAFLGILGVTCRVCEGARTKMMGLDELSQTHPRVNSDDGDP